jgi:hypothetical protein
MIGNFRENQKRLIYKGVKASESIKGKFEGILKDLIVLVKRYENE